MCTKKVHEALIFKFEVIIICHELHNVMALLRQLSVFFFFYAVKVSKFVEAWVAKEVPV